MANEVIRYERMFVSIAAILPGVKFPIDHNLVLLDSTTIPLGGGGVYTSASIPVTDYPELTFTCFADARGRISLQFSPDNVNWDGATSIIYAANRQLSGNITVDAPYFRVVFTNWPPAQTVFRLYTFGKY